MNGELSFYEVLGVARDATPAQIKAAWKRQAQLHHPDRHAGKDPVEVNAHEQAFKRAAAAFEVLGDAEARAFYDEHGRAKGAAPAVPLSAVEQTLIEAMMAVVELHNPEAVRMDHIPTMRQWLLRKRTEHDAEAAKGQKVVRALELLGKRFRHRTAGTENIFNRHIEAGRASLLIQIAAAQDRAAHINKCLAALASFSFLADAATRESLEHTISQLMGIPLTNFERHP